MDMTILGETIFADAAGKKYFGFWMPAGGNRGVAGLEVFWNSHVDNFTVTLETKKSDEADTAATPIGSVLVTTASAAGAVPVQYRFDTSSARDLVRYQVQSSRSGFLHLQFAQPLWQPN